jgi:pyridoxal phosphate enzyme (YggS family)
VYFVVIDFIFHYFYVLNKIHMSDIAGNITYLKSQLPSTVRLVAVSKTKPVTDILEAYNTGQRLFGENRVQELLNKKDYLPADIEWHLIGHLQSNKVKYIVPFISMIQSVDSIKLLVSINSEAKKLNRVIDCLLQIHIASEETKFGFSMCDLAESMRSEDVTLFRNIRLCGVMGMASLTSDSAQIKKEFRYLRSCFNSLKNNYFSSIPEFTEISMGMSGDYELAIEEGSTMIRIGSLIFGER